MLWPDTMSLATDGYLYFNVNQLNRQPTMHNGQDLRVKPYTMFRVKVNAQPVLLKWGEAAGEKRIPCGNDNQSTGTATRVRG